MEDSAKNVLGKWTMTLFYRLAIYDDFRMGQKVSPVKLKRHMTYPNIVTIAVVGLMTWWAGERTNTMVVLPAEFGHLSTKRHPTVGEWVSSGYFFPNVSDAIISGLSHSPGPISHWRFPVIKPGGPPFISIFVYYRHQLWINFGYFGHQFFLTHSKIRHCCNFWLFLNIQHRSHFLRMRPFWKATMQFGWSRCLAKTPWHLLTYLWIWWSVVATLEVQPARLMPSHEYSSTAHVEVIIPEKGHMSWVMSWGCVKDHLY